MRAPQKVSLIIQIPLHLVVLLTGMVFRLNRTSLPGIGDLTCEWGTSDASIEDNDATFGGSQSQHAEAKRKPLVVSFYYKTVTVF